jgi:hypothetical protein
MARREPEGEQMKIRRSHSGAALAPLVVVGALAIGALVVGCGSDDEGSSTTALSQSEFVAEATPICVRGNKQIDVGVHRYLSGKPSPKDVEQFVDKAVVPVTQREIDGFGQLTPPPSKADTYQALLDELRSVLSDVKENPQLLGSESAGNPFAKAQQLAKQVGLSACAKS